MAQGGGAGLKPILWALSFGSQSSLLKLTKGLLEVLLVIFCSRDAVPKSSLRGDTEKKGSASNNNIAFFKKKLSFSMFKVLKLIFYDILQFLCQN
ncbi:MAG TPA: hypothetical protein PK230_10000 [Chitinophagales bacterium]|nr:hypothetical protein [Chitinophagales bacterium]